MKSSSATLRLFTLEGSVDFISAALGIEPTEFSLIGQPVSASCPDGQKYSQSAWMLDSTRDEADPLDAHVSFICEILKRGFNQYLAIKGRLEASDVFCMFSSDSGQGCCVVTPENLSLIGACGLELIIDLYPPDGEE